MNKKEKLFVDTVWNFYRQEGRHALPWRKTKDPYRILVSELMLQQTQVERVIPKYRVFVKTFPDVRRLAAAPLGDVLRLWQGLGYNRRAKHLWQTAQMIVANHGGVFPQDEPGLRNLPGVGPYTAGAIMAFAHDQPIVLIETNVRQVFLQHFFPRVEKVPDTEILKLVTKTLPPANSREWYWALMDYGSHLKRQHGNHTVRSKHYAKQSKFTGSDRQIRGAIIRLLAEQGVLTVAKLKKQLGAHDTARIAQQLARLQAEGLISHRGAVYQLS